MRKFPGDVLDFHCRTLDFWRKNEGLQPIFFRNQAELQPDSWGSCGLAEKKLQMESWYRSAPFVALASQIAQRYGFYAKKKSLSRCIPTAKH